jgi:CubicO group peptidase (beta-lactamase class C family)
MTPSRRRILSLLLAAVLAPAALGALEIDDRFTADVRDYMDRLRKLGFAGVLLIAHDGEPLLAEGYGLADRERRIPWSPGTVSTVGSITKQFTGAAVLLLAEEGRLAVDDPIAKYFEGVPEDKRAITLHQLLTHSSGIVDLEGYGDWDPIGRDEFVRRILDQPLDFPPGESFAYSNAGYSLLGAIVEQLTGGSYERFVRRRLFLPHGLYETGYVLPAWGPQRLAQGYQGEERWGIVLERPMADDGPFWVLRANGGIHGTAYDMLRWAEALRGGRVLKPESLARLWAPHVSEGGETHYGYGWVIADAGGLKVVTHNGGNGIHFADLAIVPDARLVVFLQTNVAADFPMSERLLEQIGGRLTAGAPFPQVPDVAAVNPNDLVPLAGSYRLPGDAGILRVTADRGTVLLETEGRRAFALLHSDRPLDDERIERLEGTLAEAAAAFLAGDLGPLHRAYGGEVPIEQLERAWSRRREAWVGEHGPLRKYEVLGTALGESRDATLVRFLLERGAELVTFVWDREAEARLQGVSRRGLDPARRFFFVGGDAFASFDPLFGTSRPLRFERVDGRGSKLVLGAGDASVEAVNTQP